MQPGDRNAGTTAGVAARACVGHDRPAAAPGPFHIGPFHEAWRRSLPAGHGTVTIWFVPAGSEPQFARHARVLGRDDWAAIARVRDLAARDHMRATRIALRLALSHAVDGAVEPAAWTFETTSYGKPRVCAEHPEVHFCISHIGTLAAIAVSRDAPVGIDLETAARPIDARLVDGFCSRRERRELARLGEPDRQRAFTRLWTLKEAYAKLVGTGLATDFRSLQFEVVPERHGMGRAAQDRTGGAAFESWLTEAPEGLCQVSVAIEQDRATRRQGELLCFAAGAGAGLSQGVTATPGRGCGARVLLS